MIKIKFGTKQRKEIEEEFLAGVCGCLAESGDTESGQSKKGFDGVLNLEGSREFLKSTHGKLYHYLFTEEGKPNIKQIRELLLADRDKMKELIGYLGTYGKGGETGGKQLLSSVFRYDAFSRQNTAYTILEKMGVSVCPYCNRAYTTTLKGAKVRPQFDHYFPKSKYPYLALSLYNLIPSCGVCNRAKANLDTGEFPILYPYEEEFGDQIKFSVEIDNGDFVKCVRGYSDSITIEIINPEDNKLYKQVEEQDCRLHLTDLYNTHKDYVQDILRSYYMNTDKRVDELLQQFPDIFSTKEDVRSLMFMSCLGKDDWGKRPLAKLTYDIYREMEAISRA